jgi:hypothetical protein
MDNNVPVTWCWPPLLSILRSIIIPNLGLSAIGKHPSFIQEHYLMWNLSIHIFKIAPEKPNANGSNMGLFKNL